MDTAQIFLSKILRRLKDNKITRQVAATIISNFRKDGRFPEFMREWELDEKDKQNG